MNKIKTSLLKTWFILVEIFSSRPTWFCDLLELFRWWMHRYMGSWPPMLFLFYFIKIYIMFTVLVHRNSLKIT